MALFNDEEIKKINKVLKDSIKENGKIEESYYLIRELDENTDFERFKYDSIEKIIDYHIRYDGYIDNSNLKDVILDIEDLEERNIGVFTKANVIVSIITALILFFSAIATNMAFYLILMVYGLLWAYLSRYVGLKKGIQTGYIWGYCLGLIGFIVICVLRGEETNTEKQRQYSNNKYEDLEKLLKLKESGAITEKEFEKEKAKILE